MIKKVVSEKTIAGIFAQSPEGILGFIQKKVAQLMKLNHIWQASVTIDMAQHSRIANYRDGCLVIELASGAWATRLRYMLPEITTILLQYPDLKNLSDIEWYIQPHFHNTAAARANPCVLSSTNAQLLRNTAANIKVKSLQAALLQISENEKE